jgi:hypothetical protein
VNGAPNRDAGPTGDGSSEPGPTGESSTRDERVRFVEAAALGIALGLLLARWGGIAPS